MRKFLILISFSFLISCSNDPVQVEFIEIKNDVARFDIKNNSDKGIEKITFEITYLDISDNVLLTDTLEYQMSKENQKDKVPFLKSNDKTFIVQSIPNNCSKADIKILAIENISGN